MIELEKRFVFDEGVDYSFVNPFSLGVVAQELSDQECAHFRFFADGIAIVCYMRFLRQRRIQRISFDDTSLAPIVFSHAQHVGLSVALVGGGERLLEQAEPLLTSRYPGLSIIATSPGYFSSPQHYQASLERLALADIVVVGMGAGKQEKLLLDLRKNGWQGTGFTCGGYFDQWVQARGQHYYPAWIDRFNMRWLYRLFKEPRRLAKRYLKDYPIYLIRYGHKLK